MAVPESLPPTDGGDLRGADPAEFIRRHRWLLVGGLALGAAIGIAASFAVSSRWEADVVVRIGTIPEWAKDTPTAVSVESPARAVERIGQAAFKDQVLARLGLPADREHPLSRIFLDGVRPRTLDKSNLIAVRVWGPSPADADKFATGIVDELARVHVGIAGPTKDRFEQFLKTTEDDRRRGEAERARLVEAAIGRSLERPPSAASQGASAAATVAARHSQEALVATALATRDEAIRAQKELEFAIKDVLSPERSYPTAPLEPIRVDERPVYPRRSVFALAGAAAGLVLAALAAVLMRRR